MAMVVILCEGETKNVAETIAQDLQAGQKTLHGKLSIRTVDAPLETPPPDWDDVLLVVFQSGELPSAGRDFIDAYRQARVVWDPVGGRRPGGLIVPVAMRAEHAKPPAPIEAIKSIIYDDTARGPTGRLAYWVGVFLGLAVRGADHLVFVSYCARDGKSLAEDIYRHLEAHGFHAERAQLPRIHFSVGNHALWAWLVRALPFQE